MSDALLPAEFAELEPFAATWCLATERERFAQRMASTMDEMQAFYDIPADAERLLQLLYSLIMVSFPVEAWRQPHVPDSGAAYLDLLIEPIP